MPERGLDFSHYQGVIDWHAVAQTGLNFAIGKVTEGLTPDPTWARNRAGILVAGMHPSGYHWAHPSLDPQQCADRFAATLQQTDTMMLPWLDVEHNGNPSSNPTAAGGRSPQQIHDWIHAFAAAYGQPIGIYTGGWFWNTYVAAADCTECAARPLWLSRYAPTMGAVPAPWQQATIWQYTETGRSPGVAGNVDLDVMVGSATVAALLPGTHTPQSPEDDMSAADVSAINAHTDRAITILRTETDLGTSIANVREHQDSQGNALAALKQDVDAIKATIAQVLSAVKAVK